MLTQVRRRRLYVCENVNLSKTKLMTRDEAQLQVSQNDLAHYHAERMAKRQGEQMAALAAERAKTSPDPASI